MKYETIEDCRIYHGDCLEMLAEIKPGSVSMAMCDPPYGVRFIPNNRKTLPIPEMLANDERPHLEFVTPIVRTVKNSGAIYLCTRFDVMQQWADAMTLAGANVKSHIVWDKMTPSQGDLYGAYGNRVEIILFGHVGRHRLRNGRPDNVWAIPRPKAILHPTPKPVSLFQKCLEHSSGPGDLVLDPFLGSGASAVACVLTGRRFIGAEIDATYFEMACERIAETYREIKSRFPDFRPEKTGKQEMFRLET